MSRRTRRTFVPGVEGRGGGVPEKKGPRVPVPRGNDEQGPGNAKPRFPSSTSHTCCPLLLLLLLGRSCAAGSGGSRGAARSRLVLDWGRAHAGSPVARRPWSAGGDRAQPRVPVPESLEATRRQRLARLTGRCPLSAVRCPLSTRPPSRRRAPTSAAPVSSPIHPSTSNPIHPFFLPRTAAREADACFVPTSSQRPCASSSSHRRQRHVSELAAGRQPSLSPRPSFRVNTKNAPGSSPRADATDPTRRPHALGARRHRPPLNTTAGGPLHRALPSSVARTHGALPKPRRSAAQPAPAPATPAVQGSLSRDPIPSVPTRLGHQSLSFALSLCALSRLTSPHLTSRTRLEPVLDRALHGELQPIPGGICLAINLPPPCSTPSGAAAAAASSSSGSRRRGRTTTTTSAITTYNHPLLGHNHRPLRLYVSLRLPRARARPPSSRPLPPPARENRSAFAVTQPVWPEPRSSNSHPPFPRLSTRTHARPTRLPMPPMSPVP
ncbi:hypothetical protein Purlil1_8456 [Purpureocillium lilacinum]|uniref:Uncharacterized protein n=1 Tax=Purpureocillium lilacinum TaxID=33203 RepID=A0ABR0BU03_PURLI|nr:hypothetical protein Purlil1_8456 [Purpureocillium lilacinum]